MNILVTGGFGFVGGHLIDILTEAGKTDNIHVVDNLSSNPIPIEMLLNELGKRQYLTYEICSIKEFYKKNNAAKWDRIYHLASVVGPAGVLKYAGNIIKSIVEDVYYLIDIAIKCSARLLDVSTSEVYGGGREGFCSEEFAKIILPETTIRLEYALGKLASETALINTSKVSSLDPIIVRPFNICGPRQSGEGGFVLPRFIASAMKNEPLTIFGSGNQVRAFTHVKDIARGLIAAIEHGKKGAFYNLSALENKVSIDGLADLVIGLTKSKSKKIYVNPKKIFGPLYEETNDKFADSAKAIQDLGWGPQYTLEQIIMHTYNYMQQLDKDMFRNLSGIKDVR